MSTTDVSTDSATEIPDVGTIDMRLEVMALPVADVDRATRFYQSLGWRLDADIVVGDTFRVVQLTPTHSPSSIAFGRGFVATEPGSAQHLVLVVDDIAAARENLISRGVEVSEVFHNDPQTHAPVPGPDPQRRSYQTYASFSDPDGNGWCCRRLRRGFRDGSGARTDNSTRRNGDTK